ncbi:MAG: LytR C-terminal domain-containing protein [Gemmatimonadales bacterium]
MSPARRILGLAVVAALIVVPVIVTVARRQRPARPAIATAERAPAGVRIRVQVLNGTKTRGLAQRATAYLRDRGYDVVDMGTVVGARDTTLVLDLSGHPDWASRIARSLQPARVEARPDSSRYLDVAVVLGTAWRPPAEPFDP